MLATIPFTEAALFALLLRCPAPRLGKLAAWARRTATFTMFFHPYPVLALPLLGERLGVGMGSGRVFLASLALSLALGSALAALRRPWSDYVLGVRATPFKGKGAAADA